MKNVYAKAFPLALVVVALAGCESMKKDTAMTGDTMSRTSASTTSAPTVTDPATTTGATAGGTTATGHDMAMTPNAVVISIEPMSRASAMAGSSSAGATGSSSTATGSDQVHRVTLRMDDGSMVSVVQEIAPTFKSGDRVNVTNNMIHVR
ncbi:MAG TPA: hypothetical protein VFT37_06065 [Telluria sp.]|nr:hypothetical protein [Telluria sp.]